jgi:hypothetical protein
MGRLKWLIVLLILVVSFLSCTPKTCHVLEKGKLVNVEIITPPNKDVVLTFDNGDVVRGGFFNSSGIYISRYYIGEEYRVSSCSGFEIGEYILELLK